MTSLAPRNMSLLLRLRPARRRARTPLRPLSTTSAFRTTGFGSVPPMEPHRQRARTPERESELGVGELEGAKFRVEPLRRVGEDDKTMRARLVYQSRKRGTLESDLLLSTFADTYLPAMTREQMAQYDLFLDENDWDIYYWATQEPPPSSSSSSRPSSNPAPASATSAASIDTSSPTYGSATPETLAATGTMSTMTGGLAPDADALESKGSNAAPVAAAAAGAASEEPYRGPGEGEWAQTVGTFKPAYRPVPARWRDSEVLRLLREHVRARARERGGMAFMPKLRT
ncbi:Flavinator of succinate dehydrogenase-domain-containing protein [Biscogniauxia marginata]|nr:Flavinator of succinate dehydrogenase-domain-containing protein [Biscogniauxia marginata]